MLETIIDGLPIPFVCNYSDFVMWDANDGRVILVEHMLPEDEHPSKEPLTDLNMLVLPYYRDGNALHSNMASLSTHDKMCGKNLLSQERVG
jgi:hypothetical protein